MSLEQRYEPLYGRHPAPVIGRDLAGPEVIDESRELVERFWPDGILDLSQVRAGRHGAAG